MYDPIDPDATLEAIWCVDNETGKRHLLDLITGKIVTTQEEIDDEGL